MFAAGQTKAWAIERGVHLIYAEETGSTNSDAKKAAGQEEADLALYLAAHQTAGRGRGDHHWLDTGAGECLLSTWSFRLPSPPQAITAPRVGLALFAASRRTWPSLPWSLKAPNDLFLNGLKNGGLLIEGVSGGGAHRLLIGLGFNVLNHPRSFGSATHLAEALGRDVDPAEWHLFLDNLHLELRRALEDALRPHLEPRAREELRAALNANTNRAFEVVEISPAGDIKGNDRTISWMEL